MDPVIYGDATNEFTKLDWMELALAALDQAGFTYRDPRVEDISRIIRDLTSTKEATP